MDTFDEALRERASERMLEEFGLTTMVAEPIYRERKRTVRWTAAFTLQERQELLMYGTAWRERSDH